MTDSVEKRVVIGSVRGLPLSSSILALLTVSACGGGSGPADSGEPGAGSGAGADGSTDGGDSTPQPINYSGAVIKGPLENAVVFLDYDGDGVLGLDEPSIRTASDGSFSLAGNVAGASFVAQTDETTVDTSSGEILDNVTLKAPAGASVVTPATTIMKEAGITKEEVAAVLGLPEGVDATTFNPYAADVDPVVALAVEKVSQQVMTTVNAIASAVEGAGGSKADAFAAAMETVVEVVKERSDSVKLDPTISNATINFSDATEMDAVTEKLSKKIAETGIASSEDFDAVKADLSTAVQNVNTAISEVTDLTSEASMAAFAVATELNEQVKMATEAKGDPTFKIAMTDAAEVSKATDNK
ncbi:hypothetical protein N9H99_05270, partial [Planktomarina temperata]|nr:hypothetical protein [Planktomarina temperata]